MNSDFGVLESNKKTTISKTIFLKKGYLSVELSGKDCEGSTFCNIFQKNESNSFFKPMSFVYCSM